MSSSWQETLEINRNAALKKIILIIYNINNIIIFYYSEWFISSQVYINAIINQMYAKNALASFAFLLESETKKSSKFFVKQNQRSRKFNVDLNNNGGIILYLHKFLKLTLATLAVFSLNFVSAGKGPFMASKAKNMCPWGVEGVVE